LPTLSHGSPKFASENMINFSPQNKEEFLIQFRDANSLILVGQKTKVTWWQDGERIKQCFLTCQLDFKQYTQLDVTKFFDNAFELDDQIPVFQPDQAIEVKLSLKPSLLPQLTEHSSNLENYLSQLNTEYPKHSLFLFDSWYLLYAKQTTPSGEIIYRTIWDYLNPATLTADNIDTEEVAEAISNYFQDWTENNLADLTTEAFDTAFQDLTQGLQAWVSDNFTTTDAEELTQLFTDLGQSLETLANSDELNFPFLSPTLLETVLQFFTQDDWTYTKIQGEPTLRLAFQGKNGHWPCYAQILEDTQKLAFYSLSPTKAPKAQRSAIAEFISRTNYGMILGNFELDYTDGEIRYKTSIDVEGDRLTPALIKNLVYTNVMTMDQYLPGLLAVLEQNATPEQAIHLVEQGTPIPSKSKKSSKSKNSPLDPMSRLTQ